MSALLRKLVHNDAIREDPKEIYGWRVYMLACSVSCPTISPSSETDESVGMLRWYAFRDGNRHHRGCPPNESVHGVRALAENITLESLL
jgi:hypothetical protein